MATCGASLIWSMPLSWMQQVAARRLAMAADPEVAAARV